MAMNPNSLKNLKPAKPGECRNPGGKPKGARNELSDSFVKTLARDFHAHGQAAIERLREENPAIYIKIIADMMPKLEESKVDVNVNQQQLIEHRSVQEVTSRIDELLGGRKEIDITPSIKD